LVQVYLSKVRHHNDPILLHAVFDPDASKLLGKTPGDLLAIQESADFPAMMAVVDALVGKTFDLEVTRTKSAAYSGRDFQVVEASI